MAPLQDNSVAGTAGQSSPKKMSAIECARGLWGFFWAVVFVMGMLWLGSSLPVVGGWSLWGFETGRWLIDLAFMTNVGKAIVTLVLFSILVDASRQRLITFPLFVLVTVFVWTADWASITQSIPRLNSAATSSQPQRIAPVQPITRPGDRESEAARKRRQALSAEEQIYINRETERLVRPSAR
jgi:hypothetical protein